MNLRKNIISCLLKWNSNVVFVISINSPRHCTVCVYRSFFRHSQLDVAWMYDRMWHRWKTSRSEHKKRLHCILTQKWRTRFFYGSLHNCSINSVPFLDKWSKLVPVSADLSACDGEITHRSASTLPPSTEQRLCVPCASHSPKIGGGAAPLAFDEDCIAAAAAAAAL